MRRVGRDELNIGRVLTTNRFGDRVRILGALYPFRLGMAELKAKRYTLAFWINHLDHLLSGWRWFDHGSYHLGTLSLIFGGLGR